jgi:hypothetical protein
MTITNVQTILFKVIYMIIGPTFVTNRNLRDGDPILGRVVVEDLTDIALQRRLYLIRDQDIRHQHLRHTAFEGTFPNDRRCIYMSTLLSRMHRTFIHKPICSHKNILPRPICGLSVFSPLRNAQSGGKRPAATMGRNGQYTIL